MIAGGIIAPTTIPLGLTSAYELFGRTATPDFGAPFAIVAHAVFGVIALGLITLTLTTGAERAVARWSVMSNAEKLTLFASVIVGVGISIPFHMLFFTFGAWAVTGGFFLTLVLIVMSRAILAGMEDVLPWSRAGGRRRSRIKIFDTNVIIDGRIYEVAKSGFIEGKLYIPGFVLQELQLVADSHDANKRQRGRRGLDMLKNLQHDFEIEIGTQDGLAGSSRDPVDTRLVRLAKALGATILTNDFNLNKVAQVHGVSVLNLNDLAMAMRPQFLPTDELSVEVVREGSQPGQGVAYLEDGTMVVIECGAAHIGRRITVRVVQIHQSTAGRMVFAEPAEKQRSEQKTETAESARSREH